LSSLNGQLVIDTIEVHDLFSIQQASNVIYINQKERTGTEALKNISSLQVQQSALGGLQTILYRGMSSRHISLLWNGINIQSPINGVFDISLIPFESFDDTRLYTSSTNTSAGVNAIAGTINLKSNASKKEKSITVRLSTLSNYDVNAKTYWVTKKSVHHITAALSHQDNAYNYTLGKARLKRQNTDFNLANITYTGEAILSKNSILKGEIWYQTANRSIPTSIVAAPIDQRQNDQNTRLNLSFQQYFNHYRWQNSASFLDENLDYFSPGIISISNNQVWNVNSALTPKLKHDRSLGLNYRKDIIQANFYTANLVRNTLSVSGFRQMEWSRDRKLQLNARQDIVDSKMMPTSVSVTYSHGNNSINFNRNYQLPTFNDLYWPEGGNPDLQTELSHQGEISKNFKLRGIDFKSSAYINHVNNWIQWTPTNSGVWQPFNYKSVLARGIELQALINKKFKSSELSFKFDYSYSPTTNLAQLSINIGKGKQLIYTPLHKSSLNIDYQNQKLKGGLEAIMTSKRYDTTDNSTYLPTYLLLNATVGYNLDPISIRLDIYNLTDTDYAIVRFFPQAGLNTRLSIKYVINKY